MGEFLLKDITYYYSKDRLILDHISQAFESGKIYGLVSEYQQGCMYLSYLLGGKIDFGNLKIYGNGIELSRNDLAYHSWNLEPSKETYRKAKVKKSIENALKKNNSEENFKDIAEKFILTPQRFDRKFFQLSTERWRACAALGYAKGKRIFYAPYQTSSFYYQMCQSGLLKALKEHSLPETCWLSAAPPFSLKLRSVFQAVPLKTRLCRPRPACHALYTSQA